MNLLIDQTLLTIAILSVGVVYGTDVFHALVVKKAAALSSDHAIADLMGHTHFVADKRMPPIGVTGILCSLILTLLSARTSLACYSSVALVALILHLAIYMRVAKPINSQMVAAALAKEIPSEIRDLQLRWDSVILYRAILLTIAMIALIAGSFVAGSGGVEP
jgi:hypothetical protein